MALQMIADDHLTILMSRVPLVTLWSGLQSIGRQVQTS